MAVLNDERNIICPYCWEQIGVVLDISVTEQEYVEDCFVCCRPIVIRYRAESGEITELEARAETDT